MFCVCARIKVFFCVCAIFVRMQLMWRQHEWNYVNSCIVCAKQYHSYIKRSHKYTFNVIHIQYNKVKRKSQNVSLVKLNSALENIINVAKDKTFFSLHSSRRFRKWSIFAKVLCSAPYTEGSHRQFICLERKVNWCWRKTIPVFNVSHFNGSIAMAWLYPMPWPSCRNRRQKSHPRYGNLYFLES